jgi:hypothetical protein
MSENDPQRPYDPDRLRPGSVEQTLAGNADLRIGAILREAWDRVDGIKGPVVLGAILVYAGITLVVYLLGLVLGLDPEAPDAEPLGQALLQLVVTLLFYPFLGGVFMFGLRRSLGQPVRFEDLFSQYGRALPIATVAILQSLATFLGFMLLIVPGIYLSFALALALPLKVERDLPLFDCLTLSIRLVNQKFLAVAGLSLISALLMVLGFLSLIGWIWTVPWVMLIFAITYRQLAGVGGAGAGPSTPVRQGPTGRVTAEY